MLTQADPVTPGHKIPQLASFSSNQALPSPIFSLYSRQSRHCDRIHSQKRKLIIISVYTVTKQERPQYIKMN